MDNTTHLTSDKAVSKRGSYVPVRTAENLRPAILGFLVSIAENSAHVMTLRKNDSYNLPENWHKCPGIPLLQSSAVLAESCTQFSHSSSASHAEITKAIPPCLQFNVHVSFRIFVLNPAGSNAFDMKETEGS